MQTSAVRTDLTGAGPRATPSQYRPTSSATARFHAGPISAGLGAFLSSGRLVYRGTACSFDIGFLKPFGISPRSIQRAADVYPLGSAEAFPGRLCLSRNRGARGRTNRFAKQPASEDPDPHTRARLPPNDRRSRAGPVLECRTARAVIFAASGQALA